MSGRIPMPMGPVALVATLLLCGLGIVGAAETARADDCLAAPNSPAPEGSHWFYHIDQANQRKCWYLRATDQPAQHTDAQRTTDTASPTATPALEKPATAPTSKRSGVSTAVPLPRVKPQRAIVSAATTAELGQKSAGKRSPTPSTKPVTASASAPMPAAPDDSTAPPLRGTLQSAPMGDAPTDPSVAQSAQNGSAVSSITGAPAAQPNLSPQMNDQGGAPAPTAIPAWPDPPPAIDKMQDLTVPPSEAQADAAQPIKETPNDVDGTAQANTSTTNPGVAVSLTSTPVAVFPVVALGLLVAGFLLRIVVKVLIGRRRRIADHDDFDRIDDPHAHESSDVQIVDRRDGHTDYLQSSRRAVASKTGPRRPLQVNDERLNDALDMAGLRMDKIGKRERRPLSVDRDESNRIDDKRRQRKWRNDEQRHKSPITDPRESDRIEDHRQQGWRDDQHQHGSVDAGDELIDDLQSSLVAARSDSRSRLALQDDSSNDRGGRAAASSEEIKEREEALEQLRRSLDRLLQS